jgi:DNA-binding NtrC family response regulator
MNENGHAPIVWVGDKRDDAFDRLAAALSRLGLALELCGSVGQLPKALARWRRAVVVARDSGSGSAAAETMAALEHVYRPVPVVVLMEGSAFGRYYDLMGRGADHFYEVNEAPERIAHAVRHTAARAA